MTRIKNSQVDSARDSGRRLLAERLLRVWSVLLGAQGLVWIVIGSFDPFGLYDRQLAQVLFGAPTLPAAAEASWRYAVALLGATTTGSFVLFYFVVRYALASGAAWAYRALWASLLAWFVPDTVFSLWIGVTFNVLAVNVPCLALVGGTLLAWRRGREPATPA